MPTFSLSVTQNVSLRLRRDVINVVLHVILRRRVDKVTGASESGTVSDLRLEVQGAISAQAISLKPVLEPGKMQEVVSVKA